ncbi:two-component system response regulator CreB [Rheinheimera riviphila]|uniref:Two-component system response regulator CreB n=1 Tax=Rheinheimera riviphila TaxID=1834037 RepID=A0A437R1H0_9GAMM|nr:two-component system response regulator CreB [Rheinheimera riviphila]RVU40646.1 two-component system response regulator CreB [Rheinheimera riviphila]
MTTKILLLEDEAAIADPLIYSLQAEGFQVHWVQLVQQALAAFAEHDLLILDVGLPDGNGFELCKQIRHSSEVPVIFLTARSSEIDRVVGLEIGADDYVVKPFSPRELVARVKTILKRSQRQQSFRAEAATNAEQQQEHRGDFRLLPAQVQIQLLQQSLPLTALEYRLLSYLLQHPAQVLSREQLLQSCGVASDAGYDRNIDSHIKSLRAKMRKISAKSYILTQRGFGYSFDPLGTQIATQIGTQDD